MSSISRWPRASRQASARRSWRSLPRMIRLRPASAGSISSTALGIAGRSRLVQRRAHGLALMRWTGDRARAAARSCSSSCSRVRARSSASAFALLRHDLRGRVRDEARIGELARATSSRSCDRSCACACRAGRAPPQVVDQPRERHEHRAPVDDRDRARRQVRLGAHELDRLEVRRAARSAARARRARPHRRRARSRTQPASRATCGDVELAADLPHAEDERLAAHSIWRSASSSRGNAAGDG